jgi:murein L,D-transpeptidase YcbB/YkuD
LTKIKGGRGVSGMPGLLASAALLAVLAGAPCVVQAQTMTNGIDEAPEAAVPVPAPVPPLRSDQIALLMQTLADAPSHGFGQDEFMPAGLDALLRSASAAERKQGAVMLRAAIVAYAKAQHGGRLPASAFQKNWGLHPGPYNAEAEFNFALTQDRLPQWLDSLPPPFDRYRGLRAALGQYRAIAARGGWEPVEGEGRIDSASHGDRVVALRQRLAAEDAQSGLDTASPVFDADLTTAVQTFQHNVGLEPTGVADKATLAALAVPVESRIEQIEANLERWRWVPRVWPQSRIEVNIAAQEMSAFVDNALVLEMRAAPGRPDDQTPMLGSEVQSVVFNPPWNVPTSIATKELWPKEAAHPGYLASHGYRIISTDDNGGRRIQQKFGPKSALGKMKFDFPNNYSVYLHDTPSRAAFSKTSRTVSHGCVRLQRPLELANLLFQGDPDWQPDHIDAVLEKGDTVRAPLDKPMPIFLMYWTAFLDVKGRVNFRDDVYGWDESLVSLIAAAREKR